MKESKFDVMKTVEIEGLGEITATQGALNAISLALKESSKWNESNGCDFMSRLYYRQAHQIYKALELSGFYNDK